MANRLKQRNTLRERRARRTRAKIFGTSEKPRISFFRSNTGNYAQVINDSEGRTLLSLLSRGKDTSTKKDQAGLLGESLARKMKEANMTKGVFDRGGYKYHGRTQSFVEGLRKGGIQI